MQRHHRLSPLSKHKEKATDAPILMPRRKPEPEFYLYACEKNNVKPSECVFLDDLGMYAMFHTFPFPPRGQRLLREGRLLEAWGGRSTWRPSFFVAVTLFHPTHSLRFHSLPDSVCLAAIRCPGSPHCTPLPHMIYRNLKAAKKLGMHTIRKYLFSFCDGRLHGVSAMGERHSHPVRLTKFVRVLGSTCHDSVTNCVECGGPGTRKRDQEQSQYPVFLTFNISPALVPFPHD